MSEQIEIDADDMPPPEWRSSKGYTMQELRDARHRVEAATDALIAHLASIDNLTVDDKI